MARCSLAFLLLQDSAEAEIELAPDPAQQAVTNALVPELECHRSVNVTRDAVACAFQSARGGGPMHAQDLRQAVDAESIDEVQSEHESLVVLKVTDGRGQTILEHLLQLSGCELGVERGVEGLGLQRRLQGVVGPCIANRVESKPGCGDSEEPVQASGANVSEDSGRPSIGHEQADPATLHQLANVWSSCLLCRDEQALLHSGLCATVTRQRCADHEDVVRENVVQLGGPQRCDVADDGVQRIRDGLHVRVRSSASFQDFTTELKTRRPLVRRHWL